MSTQIFNVPAGVAQILPAPANSSVCVQPSGGGTVLLQYGADGVAPVFTSAPQGSATTPYSLNTSSWGGMYGFNTAQLTPFPMGNIGKIQVTATTGAATVLVCDLSQYPGSFPERQTVAQSGVAYTMPNSTSEQGLFSVRFHPGYFKLNFRLEFQAHFTLTNNANVKTIKSYFGNTSNSGAANFIESTAAAANAYIGTSFADLAVIGSLISRNDGQSVVWTGLGAAGGVGGSVTASTATTALNYSAGVSTVEQVFLLTGTKATGTDTLTLDQIIVKVFQ